MQLEYDHRLVGIHFRQRCSWFCRFGRLDRWMRKNPADKNKRQKLGSRSLGNHENAQIFKEFDLLMISNTFQFMATLDNYAPILKCLLLLENIESNACNRKWDSLVWPKRCPVRLRFVSMHLVQLGRYRYQCCSSMHIVQHHLGLLNVSKLGWHWVELLELELQQRHRREQQEQVPSNRKDYRYHFASFFSMFNSHFTYEFHFWLIFFCFKFVQQINLKTIG